MMADIDHMRSDKFIARLGITAAVLDGWKKRHWQYGVHYVVIGHQTFVHIERANAWINGFGLLESGRQEKASESESGATGKSATRKRSRATHTMRVVSPLRSGAGTT
jgi:hypothetical protein